MAEAPLYDLEQRRRLQETSRRSAGHWVPVLAEALRPRSVVELGCGTGEWLAGFVRAGVDEVLGLDLPEAAEAGLAVAPEQFMAADLTDPPALHREFDLALTMEVAEHLPYELAEAFVAYVCALAPAVLFGAAVPLQGGEQHHNEQYPEFWAELFAVYGFQPVDCFRKLYWNEPEASWFYAQNALLYARPETLNGFPHLMPFAYATDPERLVMLHPMGGLQVHSYRAGFERGLAEPQRALTAADLQPPPTDPEGVGWLAGLERAHRAIAVQVNTYSADLEHLPPRPIHFPRETGTP